MPVEIFSTASGLSSDYVRCIGQDQKGFLWIGTLDGLNRFDGEEFKSFYFTGDSLSLPDNNVREIIFLENDHLFISTDKGVGVYLPRKGYFKSLHLPQAKGQGLGRIVDMALLPDNNILVGTNDAILLFNGQGEFLKQIIATDIDPNWKGNNYSLIRKIMPINEQYALLKMDSELGLFILDVQSWKLKQPEDFFPSCVIPYLTTELLDFQFSDNGDGILLKSGKETVLFYDFDQQSLIDISPPGVAFRLKWNGDMRKVSANSYLLNKTVNGTFFLNIKYEGGQAIESSTYRLLDEYKGTSFSPYLDKQGNLWVGSDRGLVQLKKQTKGVKEHPLNKKVNGQLPKVRITDIYKSDNTYFIGTVRGLFLKKEGDELPQLYKHPAMTNNRGKQYFITRIHQFNKDKLWLATSNGIRWMDINTLEMGTLEPWGLAPPLTEIQTSSIFEDHKGDIWCGFSFRRGLIFYDRSEKKFKHYPKSKGEDAFFLRATDFCEKPNKDILFGATSGVGLVNWDSKNDQFSMIYPSEGGLLTAKMQSLETDSSGNIWIGTNGSGLLLWDVNGDHRQFSQNDGLSSNYIIDLVNYPKDRLWIATLNGLSVMDLNTFQIQHPDLLENLSYDNNALTTLSLNKEKQQIYIGAIDRWFEVDVDCDFSSSKINKLLLTELHADDKIHYLPALKHFSIPNAKNALTLNFSLLNLNQSNTNSIYYRFANIDSNWVDMGNTQKLNFTNLGSGNYQFEAIAKNKSGQLSSNLIKFDFDVIPPFYARWWFILSLFLFAVSLVYLFYRVRLEKVLAVQNLRNRISSDLHDDIGSTLSNISILSILGSKSLENKEKANNFLQRIQEEVQQSSQSLNDIIWTINPDNDQLPRLTERMQQYAIEMLEGNDLNATFSWPEDVSLRLSMQQRRDLFFTFKEIIHNICKHANAENVEIQLEIADKLLVLKVKDDGKGIDPQQMRIGGNGLRNMEQRVKALNGEFHLAQPKSGGTQIEIQIPFQISPKRGIV